MSGFTKALLVLSLLLFFSIPMQLTLCGGFLWPFSGHRLFSQRATNPKTIVQAILVDAQGREFAVHPGRAIPIEYSRCSGLIRKLHASGTSEQKERLCQYLIKRLNERPWHAFDEMFAAFQTTSPIIAIRFEHHTVQFHPKPYPESIELLEKQELFQCTPSSLSSPGLSND